MAVAEEDVRRGIPIVITIPPDGSLAVWEGPNATGVKQSWTLSPQRVGELLAGMERGQAQRAKWCDLLGTACPGIALSTVGEFQYVVLTFPRRVMEMRRAGRADGPHLSVSLPPSTWVAQFVSREERLRMAWLFLSSTPIRSVTDVTPVIAFPLGNVYDGLGYICWGNVLTHHLKPEDPMALDNLFFSTPFNTDLARPRMVMGAGASSPFPGYNEWVAWQVANPGGELHLPVIGVGAIPFQQKLRGLMGRQEGE